MSTQRPNHARTAAGRRGCHRRASWPPSLSLGRQPTMRASVFTLLLVGILAAVGCSHSGDFGGFFVAEVTRYGGHTITNATLPRLDARWTVKADSNGFTVQVRGVPFATVDSFMHQALDRRRFQRTRILMASRSECGRQLTLVLLFSVSDGPVA